MFGSLYAFPIIGFGTNTREYNSSKGSIKYITEKDMEIVNQDPRASSPTNQPKKSKSCCQILGGVLALVGTLAVLFVALKIFSVLWDLVKREFEWSQLVVSLVALIIGFPIMTFGYWLYTPKEKRGQYKLF